MRIPPFFLAILCFLPAAHGQEAAAPVASSTLNHEIQILKRLGEVQRWYSVLNRSKRLSETYPDSPELLLFQTAANKELGRNEETQKLAKDFLRRYPNSVNRDQALLLLGTALLLSGTRVEAASVLMEASRVTNDPTLRKKIAQTLPPKKNPIRIGLSLGGKPPATPEEMAEAVLVEERIIDIAVEEYTALHGHPPDPMGELLQGDPPILKALPEDPRRPGNSLPFKRIVKTGNDLEGIK